MPKGRIKHPYYPIIFVRGYAGTDDEVEDTVADPYMGFNVGSTKIRTLWTGQTDRHYFESPLVRLMKDYGYADVYSAGLDTTEIDWEKSVEPSSVVIYRYYDMVSSTFGEGKQITMEAFGEGLSDLIGKLRDRVCADDVDRDAFRVHLVGHSMGGLVIRTFLQNDKIGKKENKACVDKVFTYATPHKGIDFDIIGNLPAFFTLNSADNFNRKRMAKYLGFAKEPDAINDLAGRFDPDRFFCLIGTNPKDYTVARGWSSRVVGPFSDGLVRINNAVVVGPGEEKGVTRIGPRSYVHRSHSGHYGIVNSEEGYQNLVRFLFGDVRVDGALEIDELTLPDDIQKAADEGKTVRASYHFESVTRVRGTHWDLSRRVVEENSAVFREFGQVFPKFGAKDVKPHHRRPELFTMFLSKGAKVDPKRRSLGFCIDLTVLVPDYVVDGVFWLRNHYPGGHIFRDKINIEAIPPTGDRGWAVRYGFDTLEPNGSSIDAEWVDGEAELQFRIPIRQEKAPGIKATLVLTAREWNAPA